MTSKRHNPLRMIGKQIHVIMPIHSHNLREQTQLTWAKVIDSYDSVPEIYQEFFRSHLPTGEAFPYTVLTPSYESFGSRITGKLVCAIDHTIYILEEDGKNLTKVCYPINEITCVEVSSKLLEFRVTINGVTNLGVETSSLMRCSTTTDYLFAPLLRTIRLRTVSSNADVPVRELEKFNQWSDQNYKFMNLARHCLLAGETVIVAILQPEIRSGLFSFPNGTFQRVKSPTHTCILTDKELIMIREDLIQSRKDKYGGTCNYVPLNKIESIFMDEKKGTLLTVSIRLVNGQAFECLFDASHEEEVVQFVAQTRELMPKERSYIRD